MKTHYSVKRYEAEPATATARYTWIVVERNPGNASHVSLRVPNGANTDLYKADIERLHALFAEVLADWDN